MPTATWDLSPEQLRSSSGNSDGGDDRQVLCRNWRDNVSHVESYTGQVLLTVAFNNPTHSQALLL